MKFKKHAQGQNQTGDKFLKVKDGETIKGVFRGEIFEYFIKWENGKSSIVKEGTPGGKIRFRVNIAVPDGATFKIKIFEFGRPVYDQLEMLNSTYGDVTQLKVAIARKGEKLETTYMLMPLPNEPLPPPVLAKINSLELNILDGNKKEEVDAIQNVPMPSAPDFSTDPDDLPF